MAFWGHSFSYNGVPCEDFDLMLYTIGEHSHSGGKFASGVSIVEDNVASRWKPIFYGTKQEGRLQFEIVFGANLDRIEERKNLDRYEMEAIANWLTGHSQYCWLDIEQDDLEYTRYRCIITDLEMIEYGKMPWALKATVTCDSAYAYLYPQVFEYEVIDVATVNFFNESGHVGYYHPVIELLDCSGDISIINRSDNGRELKFSDMAGESRDIRIDNDLGIITWTADGNPYEHFNFNFLRLVNGVNDLLITGNCILKITCEFPVNVGG